MFSLLKYGLTFFVSFTILCIPIGQKAVFYHMQGFFGPVVEEIFNTSTQALSSSVDKTKEMALDLIDHQNKKQDKLKSNLSSVKKNKPTKKYDDYSDYEKRQLEKILSE